MNIVGGYNMSIKELDRKIDDSMLQVLKYIILDILFSICLLVVHKMEGIIIFFPILLCTILSTFSWLDKTSLWKKQKRELQEVE